MKYRTLIDWILATVLEFRLQRNMDMAIFWARDVVMWSIKAKYNQFTI